MIRRHFGLPSAHARGAFPVPSGEHAALFTNKGTVNKMSHVESERRFMPFASAESVDHKSGRSKKYVAEELIFPAEGHTCVEVERSVNEDDGTATFLTICI